MAAIVAARAAAARQMREKEQLRKAEAIADGTWVEPEPEPEVVEGPPPQMAEPWQVDYVRWRNNGCFPCWGYLRVAHASNELAYGAYEESFNGFILFVIVCAGVVVGMQTYPDMNATPWVRMLNATILWIFIFEVVVKIWAQGLKPWRYWNGPDYGWNNFDFFIVVMSFEAVSAIFGGGSVVVLRLLRLARVVKIVNKIPKLKMIIGGLISGLKSIGYILLLLGLVFYIFAVAGVYMFLPNDPFHFGRLTTALLSLWRASTLEDWTDIMYIGIYGCKRWRAGIYEIDPDLMHLVPAMKRCLSPRPSPMVAVIFWLVFITIASFCMLSLFIGVVTLAMADSLNEMKEIGERAKLKKMQDRKDKMKAAALALANGEATEDAAIGGRPFSETQQMKVALRTALDAINVPLAAYRIGDGDAEMPAWQKAYLNLAAICIGIAESFWCSTLIILCIIMAGLQLGIDTQLFPEGNDGMMPFAPIGIKSDDPIFLQAQYIDYGVNLIFTSELILKVIGEGFQPWLFFRTGWNQMDFVIVAGSWLPGAGSVKVLRLLRLLRVLKLVSKVPDLAMLINSLISGFESIGFILGIMIIVFYLFAILGMILFSTNDPFHFGTLHVAMLSLFRICTFEDWTDIMYINIYGCKNWGYMDDDSRPGPAECVDHHKFGVLAAVYFILFSIISAMVLLTLFIGVITTSMEESADRNKKKMIIEDEVTAYALGEKIHPITLRSWKFVFTILDLEEKCRVDVDDIIMALSDTNYGGEEIKELFQHCLDKQESGKPEETDVSLGRYVEVMWVYANTLKSKPVSMKAAGSLVRAASTRHPVEQPQQHPGIGMASEKSEKGKEKSSMDVPAPRAGPGAATGAAGGGGAGSQSSRASSKNPSRSGMKVSKGGGVVTVPRDPPASLKRLPGKTKSSKKGGGGAGAAADISAADITDILQQLYSLHDMLETIWSDTAGRPVKVQDELLEKLRAPRRGAGGAGGVRSERV